MVNAVPRRGGGQPIGLSSAMPSAASTTFPSTTAPPNWNSLPSYNSAIMNPDTGTLGIPWNNFLTFAAARAATITGLSGNVSTLQSQVATLQSQVATIQSQITTLQSQVSTNTSNISTLQGQVSTLQSQVSTIQGQITALQAEDTNLQNQINVIDQIFASSTVAGLPTPSGNQGRRTNVSDTSIVSFGAPPVGGGTFFAPVYCDGTQWLIG